MRCDLCSRKIDRRFRTIHFSAGAGHNSHMRLLIRVRSKMRDALCPPAALPSTPSRRPAATGLEKAICPIRPRSRKFGNLKALPPRPSHQKTIQSRPIFFGRGERIRTSDFCVPNAVLYQAELHPEHVDPSSIPGVCITIRPP